MRPLKYLLALGTAVAASYLVGCDNEAPKQHKPKQHQAADVGTSNQDNLEDRLEGAARELFSTRDSPVHYTSLEDTWEATMDSITDFKHAYGTARIAEAKADDPDVKERSVYIQYSAMLHAGKWALDLAEHIGDYPGLSAEQEKKEALMTAKGCYQKAAELCNKIGDGPWSFFPENSASSFNVLKPDDLQKRINKLGGLADRYGIDIGELPDVSSGYSK